MCTIKDSSANGQSSKNIQNHYIYYTVLMFFDEDYFLFQFISLFLRHVSLKKAKAYRNTLRLTNELQSNEKIRYVH